ncbi:DUF2179 domain-containing protein [Listeria riparia]|uniref:UPF0316 protein PRIP_15227 n=1 Tax=Listeria riparia FSL S10-1204 TaxID=1265816 RepID=W7CT47_9LIST|nr:DUF5698 domain-containing protein [Listeria riparia]EUJ42824.1 hypothetical protein PRIP_15227 [Listeria riparia FSL S10-1204]
MGEAVGMILTIFVINILYVSLNTIRLLMTMKGYRYRAAIVSVFEIVVYIVALGMVMSNLNDIANIAAYALGFGVGIVVGMKIEERLALGYITVNVITKDYNLDLANQIRNAGYGVTSWLASGRDGERMMLEILTPRKNENKLYQRIIAIDDKAFIVSSEPKQIYGGFWVKQVRGGVNKK